MVDNPTIRGFSSPALMLLDSIEGIRKVVKGGALFTLWTKYGKWESEGPSLFEKHEVERQAGDQRASANVNVPTTCYLLKLSEDDHDFHRFTVSGILIRDDYLQALNDICYFATHKALPPLQHGPGAAPGEVKNPFVNSMLSNITAAVTLLGHPGIGRSLWMYLVLTLRVLAGRPTIYHYRTESCFVFNADGLYEVPFTKLGVDAERQFYVAISSQYWCLIDCNRLVLDVPPQLSTLRAFLLQSASPRNDQLNWQNKYNHLSITYYMKPWSLSELIVGRSLQDVGKQCSEAALEVFHSRYAPSARTAYIYAYQHGLSKYNDIIATEISMLTFDMVGTVLSAAEGLGVKGVSHNILLVSPQSDRGQHMITIPTRYIYIMLRDHLRVWTLKEAASLYQIFVRNLNIKTSAGYIFDDIHDLFRRGGEWQLTSMKPNKPGSVHTHFESPGAGAKPSYIRLGYDDGPVQIARWSLPGTAEFVPLVRHYYLIDQSTTLENGYYQPALDQPTFDGFIYDEGSKTTTILRMTVATHHNVESQVVEWLRNQGVKNFCLVTVIPPDTLPDLQIPNTLAALVEGMYSLVLKEIV